MPNVSSLASLVRRTVAELLALPEQSVADDLRFRDLGLTSAQVLELVERLSEQLGRPVAASAAWEHPSVAALSARLARAADAGVSSSSSAARPGTSLAHEHDEPLAIVGMGCRFPGDVRGPQELWQALVGRVDGVREVPETRWQADAWFDHDPHAAGKMNTRWGGFLEDVRGFDAGFFGISPREAQQMDPQQRLALEVSWDALEDAGIVPASLDGSRTAVFFGAWSQDYAELAAADALAVEQHSATGWNNSIISARIAYALGLRGPVMTVNTACSSSLVALHLALSSLRNAEAELALVGGVNLLLSPQTTVQMTKFGGMSPTGRCRTFDASADGYVRGEGCGTVVLRRLSDALRAGDRIYAVIRGSAVNNDGASNGLTAPNPDAQREVLTDAWHRAGVPVRDVAYVEAHGTGTPLGDPIEAGALGEVFGDGRDEPLRVGSIKSNIGHLEGAAGIAGLMKTALSLHHGALVGNLHFEKPSALIDFDRLRLRVVDGPESFPGEGERHAGVSSFGYGGTNAHVALSESPYHRQALLPLAAHDETALRQAAGRARDALVDSNGDAALRELVSQVSDGPLRAVLRGRHPATLRAALAALAAGEVSPDCAAGQPRVVFVFSGHGSQWLGMGRDLLASEPSFARVLRECDGHIQAEAGWSVIEELCASEATSRLDQTDVLQPAIYAIQVALARTLQSWGIEPVAVIGASIGEVAAAVTAGALSEQAGAKLIVRWSALLAGEACGRGAMIVASLSRALAESCLERVPRLGIEATRLSISADLAPESVSFAGERGAVAALRDALRAEGVDAHPVAIDYACHSVEMDPLVARLSECLADIVPRATRVPMWSTVLARFVEGAELDAHYWGKNLRQPIRLREGIEALAGTTTHFLEIAPHPIGLRSIEATLDASAQSKGVALATCWRTEPAWRGLGEVASTLWCAGVSLDWAAYHGTRSPRAQSSLSVPLLISGRTEAALCAQGGRWADWLEAHTEAPWTDVVRTAAVHRSHLSARAVIRTADRSQAIDALRALQAGRAHADLFQTTRRELGGTVFVFPGQGSQWPRMGRQMLEQSPVFAEAARACDEALRPFTGWSVLAVLRGDEGAVLPPLDRVDVVQPALFTMNVALAAVWRSLGVEPAAVVGHSQGEIAAAVVCGALSLEDGARVTALRSQLIRRIEGTGAMATIELPVASVQARLEQERWSDLHVAVVNTSTSTVVAGAVEQVEAWIETAHAEGLFCRRVAVTYASHTPHVEALLAELRAALGSLSPRSGDVPMVSSVLGEPISGEALDADYWCRNLREPVRLDRALDYLTRQKLNVFVEASAHPVLTMALTAVTQEEGAAAGTLRRGFGGLDALHTSLAELHAHGLQVDWSSRIGVGPRAQLPPYAFQHEAFWLPCGRTQLDLGRAGLSTHDHPLLGSMTSLAGSSGYLFCGGLGLSAHPWLSDHAVFGTVVVPGTALLEMALAAAQRVGNGGVSELTMAAPLTLSAEQQVRLQLRVDAPDARGECAFTLFGRAQDADEAQSWTHHASGTFAAAEEPGASPLLPAEFPPAAAEPVELASVYPDLADLGYEYGPAFQCLRGAWKKDAEVYARVSLSSDQLEQLSQYLVHPALLDASLHALLTALDMDRSGSFWLPFHWSQVRLYAAGATELHVRFALGPQEGDMQRASVTAWGPGGELVLRAEGLGFRQASSQQLRATARAHTRDLYRVDWRPMSLASEPVRCHVLGTRALGDLLDAPAYQSLAELRRGLRGGAPELLVVDATDWDAATKSGEFPSYAGLATLARDATGVWVQLLQELLTNPLLAATPMLWVTSSAVATGRGDVELSLKNAPLWGAIRVARNENSDRALRLLDLGPTAPSADVLRMLVGAQQEPELAWRGDAALVPRIVHHHPEEPKASPKLAGTVLVTGGLGELGQGLARHLVAAHGVKHLVLTSRRGMQSPGAAALVASLEQAGAESVAVEACDVSVRSEVAAVIDAIPAHRPLCGVFHLAGILDDGVAVALTPEQVRRALLPKIDGAWNLHTLSVRHPIEAFVLFSSVAGVIGLQGQANYAAANAYLDVLAAVRRGTGLPALSLNWGLWEQQGIGMSAHLGGAEIARMARQGIAALPLDAGFELLDIALTCRESGLVPARLDLGGLSRALPRGAAPPALFRGLLRAKLPTATAGATSTHAVSALAALSQQERRAALLAAVQEEVASVLGVAAHEVLADVGLQSLGLDSLMSVELKNRMARRFDVSLPTTLAFDYPTPSAVTQLLLDRLGLSSAPDWDDDAVRGKLHRISITALKSSGLIEALMAQPDDEGVASASYVAEGIDVESVERDSLLDMMEEMLGAKQG